MLRSLPIAERGLGVANDLIVSAMADPRGRLLLALCFLVLVLVAVLLIVVPLARRSQRLGFGRMLRALDEARRGASPSGPALEGEARSLLEAVVRLREEWEGRAAALQEERNFLKSVMDASRGYGLIATDAEGRVKLLSASARAQLGYADEELVGKNVEVLFPEEDWNRIVPKLARRSLREAGVDQQVQLLRKDRTTFTASLSVFGASLPDGSLGFVSVFRDVSGEASREARLREAERFQQTLLEGLGDGVVVVQGGRIVLANAPALGILGASAGTLSGQPFKDLVRAEDLLMTLERMETALGGESPEEFTLRLVRGSGAAPREVRCSFSRVVHQGAPAVLATLRDETDHRSFERELQESRSLLDATLDSTPDGVLVVEHRGGKRVPILVNRRLEEFLNVRGEVLLSGTEERCFRELGSLGADSGQLEALMAGLADQPSGSATLEMSAERDRILELSWAPLGLPGGGRSGRLYCFRDITEARRAANRIQESHRALEASQKDLEAAVIELKAAREDLAARNEQLEKLNRELKSLDEMKSNLLANVSHELQTPLVLIKGYTEMILKRKIGPLTPEQEKGLTVALKNIDRLVEMIDNLLDFSRMERGESALQLEEFPLWQLIDEAVELVREKIRARGLALTTRFETEDLTVRADRAKISQVFINLLSNAIKFNREGGQIEIRVSPGERGFLKVEVQDSGIGIPTEEQGRIFERFYQVDSSPRRRFEGTGIGLSIVRDILSLHGAGIEVRSRMGEGSTFTFTLPQGRGPSPPRAEGGRSRSIPRENETLRR